MSKIYLTFFMSLFLFPFLSFAQEKDTEKIQNNYTKKEYQITMRDGVKLFTTVYTPKDTTRTYPILMLRTPYSCRPYGEDKFRTNLGPSKFLMEDGYIFVYQDVRGRWMSEGLYDNMRPIVPDKKSSQDIDESSDTYDSIEWLLKNLKYHNGKVGMWGISYPGFYVTTGAIDAHPALKASSPQAPIGDFYFDDFHHNGAYTLGYWIITDLFGIQKEKPTTESWYDFHDPGTPDFYDYFLDVGPLKNLDTFMQDNFFWQQIRNHPDYDEFWQERGVIQHLKDIDHAIMTVGGWFDAEDLYGPLNTYKAIEKNNPGIYNTIVMGPWSHGDWGRRSGRQAVGNVFFGEGISEFYREHIERNFFNFFLQDDFKGANKLPEAYMYDTGKKRWSEFEVWPPRNAKKMSWYLHGDEVLSITPPGKNADEFTDFVSDPGKPVPYAMDIKPVFIPRKYMTDDQRFASRRPDVLVFETEPLEEEVTLAGDILAKLKVSTTGTDADWIVKVIDVYPGDHEDYEETQGHIKMGGYQQLVRGEVLRGRYRNSFEKPEPFKAGKVTDVDIQLQDVYHTFKKGHKIMVHIQSSWFPYIDRNPQTFVPNIFDADEEDFQKQTHTVFHSPDNTSSIEVKIIE
jgi:putative CocE/NonD family hydrolase